MSIKSTIFADELVRAHSLHSHPSERKPVQVTDCDNIYFMLVQSALKNEHRGVKLLWDREGGAGVRRGIDGGR